MPSAAARTSILERLSLKTAPLNGEVFSPDQIQRAARYVREGKVKVVTANVNDGFAGIFGVVDSLENGPSAEVSVVVREAKGGGWSVDGSASTEREGNTGEVAALLLAAKVQHGGAGCEDEVVIPEVIEVFRRDLREADRQWESPAVRSALENLPILRLPCGDAGMVARLQEFGFVRLDERFGPEEIDADLRDCFAFPEASLAAQELRWADFLADGRPELEKTFGIGFELSEDFGLQVETADDWIGELQPVGVPGEGDTIDWFELECGVRLGRERLNLLPSLVDYLQRQPSGFRLSDLGSLPPRKKIPIPIEGTGRFIAIPAERLHDILEILVELFDDDPLDDEGRLRIPALRAAQLTGSKPAKKGNRLVDRAPDYLLRRARDIESLSPRSDAEVSPDFQAELRPYQEDGFKWLQFLREQNIGGILADDMGLGKTIQTLCNLLHEKNSGRLDLPCLIVAPKSVVTNWVKETAKFAPSLRVLTLQGSGRKRYYPVMQYSDLVVTSYPVLLRDAEELLAQEFHYVVLDEAHTIKNASARVTKVAYQIRARHRLCLSGTPIENHLGELWSQFHFLMPGFLGSEESFKRCYRIPIEKERDEHRRERLAERVAPLMLRRTKNLVAKDLPPKTEIVRSIELSRHQIDLYEAVRASLSREVNEEINRHGIEASKILILDALLKLRQICCHPRLLKLPTAQRAENSAKLDLLMDLLPAMVEEGRRVLIFSQFAQMLALVESALEEKGIGFLTLTGASKNRGDLCDAFQSGKAPVFLISLRAGGTGLNLTAADTVIHYDPWWNPALESQATDRAHRIGQLNPVFVYKLIAQGTIEEKILLLQNKKRALFEGILEGVPQKLEFSEKELEDLFAPLGE